MADRIDVFVRGTDDCLYTKSFDGSKWSAYVQLGTEKFVGDPAACSWGPNRIDVFVRGTDDCLYTKSFDGSNWSTGYYQLGTEKIRSSPRASSFNPGTLLPYHRIDVFAGADSGASASDNHINQKTYQKTQFGDSWTGYHQHGQSIIGAPSAVSRGQNRIDVFYTQDFL